MKPFCPISREECITDPPTIIIASWLRKEGVSESVTTIWAFTRDWTTLVSKANNLRNHCNYYIISLFFAMLWKFSENQIEQCQLQGIQNGIGLAKTLTHQICWLFHPRFGSVQEVQHRRTFQSGPSAPVLACSVSYFVSIATFLRSPLQPRCSWWLGGLITDGDMGLLSI